MRTCRIILTFDQSSRSQTAFLFSFSLIWTFHMSHVSIQLAVNRAWPFQQIVTKWGEWSVTLQSTTSPTPPHARVFGAERPLTVSHSKTPSCAWRYSSKPPSFPSNQIPDMPLLFPLAKGHWGRVSVLLCAHHHPAPLCSNTHFIFLKQI